MGTSFTSAALNQVIQNSETSIVHVWISNVFCTYFLKYVKSKRNKDKHIMCCQIEYYVVNFFYVQITPHDFRIPIVYAEPLIKL
jgi:hypothetical protein